MCAFCFYLFALKSLGCRKNGNPPTVGLGWSTPCCGMVKGALDLYMFCQGFVALVC